MKHQNNLTFSSQIAGCNDKSSNQLSSCLTLMAQLQIHPGLLNDFQYSGQEAIMGFGKWKATACALLNAQYGKTSSLTISEQQNTIFSTFFSSHSCGQRERRKTTTMLQPKDTISANYAIFTTL
jgi:hypothetical protein